MQLTPAILTDATRRGFRVVVQASFSNVFGLAEYVTPDNWVGIRQPGGRLDEFPLAYVTIDPT